MALFGSTAATLMQKKIGHSIPLMIGTTIQFGAAAIVLLAVSFGLGRTHFVLTTTAVWSMAWAVLVTSIAAVLLLLWLLNRGTAAKVSSLLYLVPPMAVLQALILFGEKGKRPGDHRYCDDLAGRCLSSAKLIRFSSDVLLARDVLSLWL